MYNIIDNTKPFQIVSAVLILISIACFIIFGLNLGIDFTGGSMLDIEFQGISRPSINEVQEALTEFELENLKIQPIEENGYLMRMQTINETKHQNIIVKLQNTFTPEDDTNQNLKIETIGEETISADAIEIQTQNDSIVIEKRFDSIGPVIGEELKQKSIWAIFIVLIAIVLYIAYVFRKVAKPVESWKYGLSAIAALAHDVIIIMGVFCILGYLMNVEIDSFFITALLIILGYSVNDTIVTFDRVRENLHKKQHLTFKELINVSIKETLTRSINTSLTTFIILISVFIFGGETIKFFVLALMLGVVIGTYSSIFVASPLLLFWYKRKYK